MPNTGHGILAPMALSIALVSGALAAPAPQPSSPAVRDVVAANIDASVNPGDDFFAYANGAWLKANPIPPAESHWGIDKLVDEDLYTKLRTISEQAAANKTAAPGSDERKIGDFWEMALDQARADRLGITPLQADFARIDAIKDRAGVLDLAFALQRQNLQPFFNFGIAQDEKASDVMAVYVQQGGLGLPDRDYYFGTEAGTVKAREAYVLHMGNVLRLLGADAASADTRARAVMSFETALAKISRPLADLRDPQKNYNKMSPSRLTRQYTPSIAWTARMRSWNLTPRYLIVGQPEFFAGLESALATTALPTLRDYLRMRLIDSYAPYLSKPFDDEHFNFFGRVLSGQKEQRPRWKRALDAQNEGLGMVLGRIFVKAYFPAGTKQRYSDLVEAIRTAYGERIDRLDWMSAATKAKAHEKLAKVTKKVGYPDKWKDYSALLVARNSYAENVRNAQIWLFNDALSKFGKPVDRTEWDITPQTYNAFYNSSNNEIVLPAAIFAIPGFKDTDLDDAVIYGYAAASTIGHELTHGFDDEGRQFDAAGNLVDWWTPQDAAKFKRRAAVMVRQFDAYEPLPGMHINGSASLGENIADFGGLLIGLDAFEKTAQFREGRKIAGLTPLQRYFLGYALGWLSEERDELLRKQLLSDVHAPPKWRVNGPLSNIPAFYEAFQVKPGQRLYRAAADRVRIW
ncbi:MAG TPA: M13 family metallopeptidase [Steroidobacteraceae bacterium]|nr:M13 family metallopeptidase [Steroidobacteraceae bacterium]